MILRDHYAGYRNRLGIVSSSEIVWTEWDYILAEVFQVIDDYTDKNNGMYIPYDQSGEVDWDVRSYVSGHDRAIEKEQGSRKLGAGERLYAVPIFGDKKPTLMDWIKDMNDEVVGIPEQARGARPPTADELAALRSAKMDK